MVLIASSVSYGNDVSDPYPREYADTTQIDAAKCISFGIKALVIIDADSACSNGKNTKLIEDDSFGRSLGDFVPWEQINSEHVCSCSMGLSIVNLM